MPALPTVVSTYIDGIIDALRIGSDLGQGLNAAGRNYLRGQDLATVLELLQESSASTVTLAAAGTTSTVVVTSAPAGLYAGATVTFSDTTTTAALQGVTATVDSNTTTVLTLAGTLPAAPAIGDIVTISHGFLNASIAEIRQGKSKGEGPVNAYGLNRTAMDALQKLVTVYGGTLPETSITRAAAVTAAGSTVTEVKTADTYRIDELKGFTLVISGESRPIVGNNEDTLVFVKPLASAPAAATAYSVKRLLQASPITAGSTHPGGHPDNVHLANVLEYCSALATSVVLPV